MLRSPPAIPAAPGSAHNASSPRPAPSSRLPQYEPEFENPAPRSLDAQYYGPWPPALGPSPGHRMPIRPPADRSVPPVSQPGFLPEVHDNLPHLFSLSRHTR